MSIKKGSLIKIRIQLKDNFHIGPGKVLLLEKINETGSISKAAESMGLSYRKAWRLVNELNKYSIKKLVNAKPGGQGVRGAHLSEEAKKFIKLFKKIEKSFKVLTAKEKKDLEKIFGKI